MNALEIKHLTKSFNDFKLDDLTLTLPSGCIMGLVGENGAGKSTTIRLILNSLRKDSGSITVLGQDNEGDLRELKEDIGVVIDEAGIPDCLTAGQVGKIMSGVFRQWEPGEYDKLLRELDIPANKPFKDFSRGMRMKLGIAVALSHRPKLLLLDEATSGLDPVVRDEVISKLADFTREENHSVLISSHIVSDLEKICDYIAFLHKGRLLLCEEKDKLLEEYCIVHAPSEELDRLPSSAVLHRKDSQYGSEAVVQREYVPESMEIKPITIEELFIYSVKEDKEQ